jgi:hypothetical protein
VLTATVTGGTTKPTGLVEFFDGGRLITVGKLNAQGVASYSTNALSPGSHAITAWYEGDTHYEASSSVPITQYVGSLDYTALAFTATPNPSTSGQTVAFMATVTHPVSSGTPTGTITISQGSNILAVLGMNSSGVETWSTNALVRGKDVISAQYSGDNIFAPSLVKSVTETVN